MSWKFGGNNQSRANDITDVVYRCCPLFPTEEDNRTDRKIVERLLPNLEGESDLQQVSWILDALASADSLITLTE